MAFTSKAMNEEFHGNNLQLQFRSEPDRISPQNLVDLMKTSQEQFAETLFTKFGGLLQLCRSLNTSQTDGLNDGELDIHERRTEFGKNSVQMQKPLSFLRLLLNALKEPTLIILEVAAVVSIAISIWSVFRPEGSDPGDKYEWIEGLAILLAVVVIVLVTAGNDFGKEKQFRKLQEKVKLDHKISVVRGGRVAQIPSAELVVGDVCLLKYGDIIPADGIVLQGHGLQVDESSLTGESESRQKSSEIDPQLLAGAAVLEGSGRMLVLAVGVRSQSGSISLLLGASEVPDSAASEDSGTTRTSGMPREKNKSILQEKLQVLASRIGKVGMVMGIVTSSVLILRFCIQNYGIDKKGWNKSDVFDLLDAVIMGITVLVVAIPEGLPLAVTLTLAVAGKKMMNDHNLVRHLFACETMGCATTICSDKTGTLTTNRMTVTSTFIAGHLVTNAYHPTPWLIDPVPQPIMEQIAVNIAVNSSYTSNVFPVINGAVNGPEAVAVGNSTDCALLAYLRSCGYEYGALRLRYPEESFVKVFPFDSFRKFMATVIRDADGFRVLVKGAPEVVLDRCSAGIGGKFMPENLLPETKAETLRRISSEMASVGLRTISLATRFISASELPVEDIQFDRSLLTNLTYLGTFGIEDPVRVEVPSAILQCQHAGITVRMITGDNKETAQSVARKCGILAPQDDSLVLDSREFNQLIKRPDGTVSQEKIDTVWPRLRVLARSTPEDKYNLVNGIINSRLSENQEVVAVTGDGTNDAPALKKADVGFAMGIAGTDIAKEASDIIITDDNFISIVKACMWGRNIYDNIGKFLQFQLTVTVVATGTTIIAVLILGVTPIKAVPMLWINLIQDTLASLALATEPPSMHLLGRKPHGRKKAVLSSITVRNILGQSLYQVTVLMVLLFAGPVFLHPRDVQRSQLMGPNDGLYTLIFNTFVMMSLFNLINCRCVENERNVFARISRNVYFAGLWSFMFVTQVLVTEFGGFAFSTTGLSWRGWLISIAVGLGSWCFYQMLVFLPAKLMAGFVTKHMQKVRRKRSLV